MPTKTDRAKSLEKSTDLIMENNLWAKILVGMILGVTLGIALSPDGLGLWEEGWLRAAAYGERYDARFPWGGL